MNYQAFLESKSQIENNYGFEPKIVPSFLFDFQRNLIDWSVRKGCGAIFADCGLGKTPMELVWAQNIVEKTNKPVLIVTPLAVGPQHVREGEKFGIECGVSRVGDIHGKIVITNYQRLKYFNPADFAAVVCDESGILKSFDGETKGAIIEFMRKIQYRLLGTATPSPNDYTELGNSSEALGELGYIDMLKMFFKSENNSYAQGGGGGGTARRFSKSPLGGKYHFRGHAEQSFWRWVCSWARAVRKPEDLGCDNSGFILPELKIVEHIVKATTPRDDFLFDMPAITLQEQRAERRRTINERCELAAELVNRTGKPAICWCHLNEEGHLLEKLIKDAVEVEGNDTEEFKEETLSDFALGKIRVLVSKPTIAGWGMNFQHCAHQTFFPSHSFEQWYQAVRRSWRFGQKNPVKIDMIASEGESGVLSNLNRKQFAADQMFQSIVGMINNELRIQKTNQFTKNQQIPSWL